MRVLHLLKTASGASWALRQTRELALHGVEVHAAMPPGPLVRQYEQAGVKVHLFQSDLPVREPWRIPAHLARFRRLVEHVTPDLLHSHFVGTTLTMRLALGRSSDLPRIFQVPGPLHLEHALFRELEVRTAGPLDSWMGSCRWTCDRYRSLGIPQDRVFLSYYGVDVGEYAPQPPGTLRAELGLRPDVRVVGMVAYMYGPKRYLGQRRGLKGHEDLIDALALLRRDDPKTVGVFVGGAWGNAREYEARVRRYGAERLGPGGHFLGTRRDVPRLYADFDVAVHPSHSENVGGAAESLTLGVPTIATDVGGFPDVVVDGETGWLVPARDPVRLAGALKAVLADPAGARAVAAEGRARTLRMFDVRRTALDVLSAYETVTARHRPGARRASR